VATGDATAAGEASGAGPDAGGVAAAARRLSPARAAGWPQATPLHFLRRAMSNTFTPAAPGDTAGDVRGRLGFLRRDETHQVDDAALGHDADRVERNLLRVDELRADLGADRVSFVRCRAWKASRPRAR